MGVEDYGGTVNFGGTRGNSGKKKRSKGEKYWRQKLRTRRTRGNVTRRKQTGPEKEKGIKRNKNEEGFLAPHPDKISNRRRRHALLETDPEPGGEGTPKKIP